MDTRKRLAKLALTASALLASGCAPSPSGPDTSPPNLTVPERAAFVVGSQIITNPRPEEPETGPGDSRSIQALLTWTGKDSGSGICGYDVYRVFAGAEPGLLVQGTLETSFVYTADTDYDDQFGYGMGKVEGWNIVARDCAGNTATKYVRTFPVVIQEDGQTFYYGDRPPTYAGSWSTISCDCSDGAVASTTQAGASVTYVHGDQGRRIALVMDQAPNRGRFRVLINGVEQAVVDNGAGVSTRKPRVIVWEGAIDANAVVQVVNLATTGRPRIDLDAIIIR